MTCIVRKLQACGKDCVKVVEMDKDFFTLFIYFEKMLLIFKVATFFELPMWEHFACVKLYWGSHDLERPEDLDIAKGMSKDQACLLI